MKSVVSLRYDSCDFDIGLEHRLSKSRSLLVSGFAVDPARPTFITCSAPKLQEEFSSCGFIQSE